MSQPVSRRQLVRVVARQLLDEPQNRTLWLQRLAAYLVTHGIADQVDLVVNDIAYELQQQAGLVTVEVVTARALDGELRQTLHDLLRAQTGAESVVLYETTDANLIGGYVARTADAEIDASVRTKLMKLAALA